MESGWRNVSTNGLSRIVYDDAWQLFLNGNCHWFAHARQFRRNFILSFDTRSETFDEITLPVDSADCVWTLQTERTCFFVEWNSPHWNPVEYMGLLGLTHHELDKKYSLWVMNEYGKIESWTKVLTINLDNCWLPVGFRSSGEVLLFEKKAGSSPQSTDQVEGDEVVKENMNLVSYDPNTSQSRVLRTCSAPAPSTFSHEDNDDILKTRRKCKYRKILTMCYHMESLILLEEPIGGMSCETMECEGVVHMVSAKCSRSSVVSPGKIVKHQPFLHSLH